MKAVLGPAVQLSSLEQLPTFILAMMMMMMMVVVIIFHCHCNTLCMKIIIDA